MVNQLYYAGKEAGIMKISSRMDSSQFEVDIVVLGKIVKNQQFNADQLRTIELNKKPGNDPKILLKLARIFKKNQYDIIYTHAWNTLLEGYIPAVLARTPVKIHGEHGTFERSPKKDRLQRSIWGRFDAVTVVAADLQNKMRDLFGYTKENVTVVYNGIDVTKLHPSAEKRQAFREAHGLAGKFLVGTVGRFHPVKDHFTLIRGFARFRASVPEARLLFVGKETDDLYPEYTKLMDELGVREDVVLVDPTPDVDKIYAALDVFVLSSISEGCSNVILESLGCGAPVLATRTGGNPELVQENINGLLFKVGDDKGLADRLMQLYNDAAMRKAFGAAGSKYIHEHFTIENTVRNYENLYRKLYEHKRRAGAIPDISVAYGQ